MLEWQNLLHSSKGLDSTSGKIRVLGPRAFKVKICNEIEVFLIAGAIERSHPIAKSVRSHSLDYAAN